jgi:hypothetical protein
MTLNSDGRNPEELDEATPESATGDAAAATGDENDTQGQMFLPDRTAEYLAKARERDIRQNASRREMQTRGKSQGGRR